MIVVFIYEIKGQHWCSHVLYDSLDLLHWSTNFDVLKQFFLNQFSLIWTKVPGSQRPSGSVDDVSIVWRTFSLRLFSFGIRWHVVFTHFTTNYDSDKCDNFVQCSILSYSRHSFCSLLFFPFLLQLHAPVLNSLLELWWLQGAAASPRAYSGSQRIHTKRGRPIDTNPGRQTCQIWPGQGA